MYLCVYVCAYSCARAYKCIYAHVRPRVTSRHFALQAECSNVFSAMDVEGEVRVRTGTGQLEAAHAASRPAATRPGAFHGGQRSVPSFPEEGRRALGRAKAPTPTAQGPVGEQAISRRSSRGARRLVARQRDAERMRDAANYEPYAGYQHVANMWEIEALEPPASPDALDGVGTDLRARIDTLETVVLERFEDLEARLSSDIDFLRSALVELMDRIGQRCPAPGTEVGVQTVITAHTDSSGGKDSAGDSSSEEGSPPEVAGTADANRRVRECDGCNRSLPQSAFSGNQWRKPLGRAARCRVCLPDASCPPGAWSCTWCGETIPASQSNRSETRQHAWCHDHIIGHVHAVEDENSGRVADLRCGTVVVSDRDGFLEAGASSWFVDELFASASLLASYEFGEACATHISSETGRIYLAVDGMSFEFRGYISVSVREAVYGDGSVEDFEYHIDFVAVADAFRRYGIGGELVEEALEAAATDGAATSLWCVKGMRRFYAQWCFYDTEPTASPDTRPPDCAFMRLDARPPSSR